MRGSQFLQHIQIFGSMPSFNETPKFIAFFIDFMGFGIPERYVTRDGRVYTLVMARHSGGCMGSKKDRIERHVIIEWP